jgi:hypothetical protein
MNVFEWLWWGKSAVSDIQADTAATRLSVNTVIRKIDQLEKDVKVMAAREDAAYEKLNATILTVKDGWASLVAERDALKEALENADADAAAQVQAALDADSDVDAGKVEAADAALAELVPAAPEEPAEEPQA